VCVCLCEQVAQMEQKDARIKIVNEILNGIKVIKLYAWEHPFNQLVMGIRNQELGILRKYAFLRAGFAFTWTCAPFMVRLRVCVCMFVFACSCSTQILDRIHGCLCCFQSVNYSYSAGWIYVHGLLVATTQAFLLAASLSHRYSSRVCFIFGLLSCCLLFSFLLISVSLRFFFVVSILFLVSTLPNAIFPSSYSFKL